MYTFVCKSRMDHCYTYIIIIHIIQVYHLGYYQVIIHVGDYIYAIIIGIIPMICPSVAPRHRAFENGWGNWSLPQRPWVNMFGSGGLCSKIFRSETLPSGIEIHLFLPRRFSPLFFAVGVLQGPRTPTQPQAVVSTCAALDQCGAARRTS